MSPAEAQVIIDAYLLGERKDRESVFAKLASFRPETEAALPIVRALGLLGARAADESLMALRLILSAKVASDDAVRAVRASLVDVRKGVAGARDRYFSVVGAVAT